MLVIALNNGLIRFAPAFFSFSFKKKQYATGIQASANGSANIAMSAVISFFPLAFLPLIFG